MTWPLPTGSKTRHQTCSNLLTQICKLSRTCRFPDLLPQKAKPSSTSLSPQAILDNHRIKAQLTKEDPLTRASCLPVKSTWFSRQRQMGADANKWVDNHQRPASSKICRPLLAERAMDRWQTCAHLTSKAPNTPQASQRQSLRVVFSKLMSAFKQAIMALQKDLHLWKTMPHQPQVIINIAKAATRIITMLLKQEKAIPLQLLINQQPKDTAI